MWRAFGTGLFLAIIGVGGSLLAMTLFPLIAVVTRDLERRRLRIQRVVHRSFQLYCWGIRTLRVADIQFEGAEKLQGLRGALIVANHPSLLDVVMIMAAIPNVQCVVKGGLWKNPFFRLTVEGAGYIRNDHEPEALLAACVQTLKAGNNLIVFPEGTRTVRGRPTRLRRGFANIVLEAEAPIQLIRMSADPPLLHKGNPWWRVPESRTKFRMQVCDLLDISSFLGYRFRSQATRHLVAKLETFYADELGHGPTGTGLEATDRFSAAIRGSVA
ncbi:MAG: 1-acyl-sn-glycerol-3-phosphate acyltransferase [Magnetospirillum gryphiswaldense]|nr:1-acyl-sn-glycerol-3-phosphate acyltransferase [Magnetospirillum gryphiswaldense]